MKIEKLALAIPLYRHIVEIATEMKIDIYLVGGSLRNLILNKPINDWDFVLLERAIEFSKILADRSCSTYVLLDDNFGIARIVPHSKKIYLDFADSRGDFENDLSLRDFTINAIALNIQTGKILDPSGGKDDIKKGIIRAYSRRSISDDPLRILRAYRMKSQFNFEIEEKTNHWMMEEKENLIGISFERIRDEIFKILKNKSSFVIIKSMYDDGVLQVLIPELIHLDGLSQNSYHKFDVLRHSFTTLDEMEKLIEDRAIPLPYRDKIEEYLSEKLTGDRTRLETLKFAVILHDIGKPDVRRIDYKGTLYYSGHQTVGRDIWNKIAERSKLSNKEIAFGSRLVEYHLEPVFMPLEKDLQIQRIKLYRFFKAAGKSAPGVILLSWGDVEAGQGEALTQQKIDNHHNFSRDMLKLYFEEKPLAKPPRFLSGKTIMELLDLEPGERVGEILSALELASALENVLTKEEAVKFCMEYYNSEKRDIR